MKKFYIADGDNQIGPFDLGDLKSKEITSETKIWYEGAKDWIKAGKVKELKDVLKIVPPPLKPQTTENKKKRRFLKPVLLILGIALILIIIGGLLIESGISRGTAESYKSSYTQKVMSVKETELQNPTRFLDATGTYKENFLGGKLKVNVEVRNSATAATFKDAVVRVNYYSKSKTKLGSKDYTLYEVFPPNSKRTINLKVENYKDVNTIGWDVISAKPY